MYNGHVLFLDIFISAYVTGFSEFSSKNKLERIKERRQEWGI